MYTAQVLKKWNLSNYSVKKYYHIFGRLYRRIRDNIVKLVGNLQKGYYNDVFDIQQQFILPMVHC
jgi:hypothetical protein